MNDTTFSTGDVTVNAENGTRSQIHEYFNDIQREQPLKSGPRSVNGPSIAGVQGCVNTNDSSTRVENGQTYNTETPKSNHSKCDKLKDSLEKSVSSESRLKIDRILDEVNQLSDVEKLLLYLRLPTDNAAAAGKEDTSSQQCSMKAEHNEAINWIRSHLAVDSATCMPKLEVYEDYRIYCESHQQKALSAADFGKTLKVVYPSVKPRRLGQRGQSRYCYSGIKKKLIVEAPSLPYLDVCDTKHKMLENDDKPENDIARASSDLVCEWAEKLLNVKCRSIQGLAEHLVANTYVRPRSVSALTVMSSIQENSGKEGSNTTPTSMSRHREAQLQLQRKIQEREQIREQRKRLEEQRSECERQQITIDLTGSEGDVSPATSKKTRVRCASSAQQSGSLQAKEDHKKHSKNPKRVTPMTSSSAIAAFHSSISSHSNSQAYSTLTQGSSVSAIATSVNAIATAHSSVVSNSPAVTMPTSKLSSVSAITSSHSILSANNQQSSGQAEAGQSDQVTTSQQILLLSPQNFSPSGAIQPSQPLLLLSPVPQQTMQMNPSPYHKIVPVQKVMGGAVVPQLSPQSVLGQTGSMQLQQMIVLPPFVTPPTGQEQNQVLQQSQQQQQQPAQSSDSAKPDHSSLHITNMSPATAVTQQAQNQNPIPDQTTKDLKLGMLPVLPSTSNHVKLDESLTTKCVTPIYNNSMSSFSADQKAINNASVTASGLNNDVNSVMPNIQHSTSAKDPAVLRNGELDSVVNGNSNSVTSVESFQNGSKERKPAHLPSADETTLAGLLANSSTAASSPSASTMLTLLSQRVAQTSQVKPSLQQQPPAQLPQPAVSLPSLQPAVGGMQKSKYAPIKPKPARTVFAMLQEQRGYVQDNKSDGVHAGRKRVSTLLQESRERQITGQNPSESSAKLNNSNIKQSAVTMVTAPDSSKKRTSELASLLSASPNAKAAKIVTVANNISNNSSSQSVPAMSPFVPEENKSSGSSNSAPSTGLTPMQIQHLVGTSLSKLLQQQQPSVKLNSAASATSNHCNTYSLIQNPAIRTVTHSQKSVGIAVTTNSSLAARVSTHQNNRPAGFSSLSGSIANIADRQNMLVRQQVSSTGEEILKPNRSVGQINRPLQNVKIEETLLDRNSNLSEFVRNSETSSAREKLNVSVSELGVSSLERDTLDEYTCSDQSPDLAEINPSISPIVTTSTQTSQDNMPPGGGHHQQQQQQKFASIVSSREQQFLQNSTLQMLLARGTAGSTPDAISFNQQMMGHTDSGARTPSVDKANNQMNYANPASLPAMVSAGYCMNFYKEAELGLTSSVNDGNSQRSLGSYLVSSAGSSASNMVASTGPLYLGTTMATSTNVSQQTLQEQFLNRLSQEKGDSMKLPLQLTRTSLSSSASSSPSVLQASNTSDNMDADTSSLKGNLLHYDPSLREQTPSYIQSSLSQPSPHELPVHRSPNSTPQFALSPQVASVQQNVFVPIHSSAMFCANTVSPVRPMATLPGQSRVDAEAAKFEANQQQGLQNLNMPRFVHGSAGFMPYNAVSTYDKNPPSYEVAMQQQQQQKALHQSTNLPLKDNSHQFVHPPENMKPIRRQQRQNRKSSARSRHNSASATLSYSKVSQNGLNATVPQYQQNGSVPQEGSLLYQNDFQSSMFQSPYSPEVSNIMNLGEQDNLQQGHRSHSVPASALCQSIPGMDQSEDSMDSIDQSNAFHFTNMTNLLQDKIQGGEYEQSRGIHNQPQDGFVARRNLTDIWESGIVNNNNSNSANTSFTHIPKADAFSFHNDDNNSYRQQTRISRDPVLPNLGCSSNTVKSLQQASKLYQRSLSFPGPAVPTPPSSQNGSPDFTSEIQNITGQSGDDQGNLSTTFAQPMPTPDTDTPSSFGSHHDSRDSLTESLFPTVCENINNTPQCVQAEYNM